MSSLDAKKEISCFAYKFGFPIKLHAFGIHTWGKNEILPPAVCYKKFSGVFRVQLGPTSSLFWPFQGGGGLVSGSESYCPP